MAKAPSKTLLRTASKSVKSNFKKATQNSNSENGNVTNEQLEALKVVQGKIDHYNNVEIYEIDSFFKDLQLSGEWIIVRLFYENLIKFIDESNPNDIQVDAWHRQIDVRQRTTDTPKWAPTPFPYTQRGVVVAVSPELKLRYLKLRKDLKEAGDETVVHIPQVGDVVNIRAHESGWFKEHRYYPDKQLQCQDFVRNQVELRLNRFSHYFSLEHYDIESWETNPEKRGEFVEKKDPKQNTNKKKEEVNDLQASADAVAV